MGYKIREGIVLETVCGESMLFSTYKARAFCPAIFQLNEASLLIWNGIKSGLTEQEIAAIAEKDFEISSEEAFEAVSGFVEILKNHGYLITE